MLGIIIAIVYAAYNLAFSNLTNAHNYLASATFLYKWYWFWAIVLGCIACLVGLLITLAGVLGGSEVTKDSKSKFTKGLGVVSGAIIGGGASFVFIALFIAREAVLILGAYLLMTAGEPSMALADFDLTKIILGVVLIFISIKFLSIKDKEESESKGKSKVVIKIG